MIEVVLSMVSNSETTSTWEQKKSAFVNAYTNEDKAQLGKRRADHGIHGHTHGNVDVNQIAHQVAKLVRKDQQGWNLGSKFFNSPPDQPKDPPAGNI